LCPAAAADFTRSYNAGQIDRLGGGNHVIKDFRPQIDRLVILGTASVSLMAINREAIARLPDGATVTLREVPTSLLGEVWHIGNRFQGERIMALFDSIDLARILDLREDRFSFRGFGREIDDRLNLQEAADLVESDDTSIQLNAIQNDIEGTQPDVLDGASSLIDAAYENVDPLFAAINDARDDFVDTVRDIFG
jgi:hypothetical protein